MTSKLKRLAIYLLPFLAVIELNVFGVGFLTEVTGNTGQTVWILLALIVYYLIVLLWHKSLAKTPIIILTLLIFSLMFLPVRQNISVISYVSKDADIYWLERAYFTGEVSVFVAPKSLLLARKKLLQREDIAYEAFLQLTEKGEVILVYADSAADNSTTTKSEYQQIKVFPATNQ
ncbi:hypothetical protein [Rheinheimera salexigens]|uniref:Uncharacterized protein n=1 Tax=Rheinheimera salexigens TaxID=1628148 RepID=A0A1E7Q2L1_9GAMM|nr:hypothetical protein [Rheinheimera salexigens]OEY68350.1 hypothetical protein BI198_01275 [Rheinheimera salexigens]